jgi:hypothetical protein
MKHILQKIYKIIRSPIDWYKSNQEFKKKLAELRKRDPFNDTDE